MLDGSDVTNYPDSSIEFILATTKWKGIFNQKGVYKIDWSINGPIKMHKQKYAKTILCAGQFDYPTRSNVICASMATSCS